MSFVIEAGKKLSICYAPEETEAVKLAAANLIQDLKKVLPGIEVSECNEQKEPAVSCIHIGTIGISKAVEAGIDRKQLEDGDGRLYREAFQLREFGGELFIAGTDRRGTVYGIYTLCEWMGVSPWYFFADVPVKEREKVELEEGLCHTDRPSVEYRGIFINDEEELEAWVQQYMGEPTIGVKSYEKIFELLLRLKANYIWPAMHVNSFNLKQENGALAEQMGIVVGTSHCDMLMRSNNREWKPWLQKKGYGDVHYDYSVEGRNREILKEYWRESVEQNRDFEVCYTLGMRGIHDSGFETRGLEGKSEEEIRKEKVKLLDRIITEQRKILKSTLKRETMTTFIPYKEVLDLYDHGLEIPEDVTLVWANDNYGYIRRFPSEKERGRSGGNGIYYHNSYWSPPSMSYVFLCSIPLAHTRNELQKAWDEGIRRLWVLNCGAIKPLEQEITFFLRLAWEIGKQGALTEDVDAFVEKWINDTFSGGIGAKAARLLNDFSQLTNVRKIENMAQDAFSQTAYGDEAALRIHRYEELFREGNALYRALPEEEKAAFFQLVLMRIHAAYFTNLAYYYGDRSTLSHDRGNMQAAALYTEKSREAEDARRKLLQYYNRVMSGGKWNGILNPEAFPPPRAAMMPVCTPPIAITGKAGLRVDVWNDGEELEFTTPGEKWLDIGNTGNGELHVRLRMPEWVETEETVFTVRTEKRVLLRVTQITESRQGSILVETEDGQTTVEIPISVRAQESACDEVAAQTAGAEKSCFADEENLLCADAGNAGMADGVTVTEEDGIIALEADSAQSPDFKKIRRLGRLQGSLMEARAEGASDKPEEGSSLCYRFRCYSEGSFLLELHRFPSLNATGEIRVGIAVDGHPMQIAESVSNDEWRGNWKENVLHNVERLYLQLPAMRAGIHELRVYAVDRYFAFSRMIIYTKPRKENELAGLRGDGRLPDEECFEKGCETFYGRILLRPRPIFYASGEWQRDGLALTDRIVLPERYAPTVSPGWYLKRGEEGFSESRGAVCVDAAAALAQSRLAWSENALPDGIWRHCAGESFGRSGLAMYLRGTGKNWSPSDAPSLNYRFACEGGRYTVWLLAKFNVKEESRYAIAIDGEQLKEEVLYGNGCLWRYESEQIYRWVPVTAVRLEKGEHLLQLGCLAAGMRFDRIYLKTGEEYPPSDEEWERAVR